MLQIFSEMQHNQSPNDLCCELNLERVEFKWSVFRGQILREIIDFDATPKLE